MTWVGSGSAWIRNFCLDPDPELGKFRAGSGSGINHSRSTTLLVPVRVYVCLLYKPYLNNFFIITGRYRFEVFIFCNGRFQNYRIRIRDFLRIRQNDIDRAESGSTII